MAKLSVQTIANLTDESRAVGQINANFAAIVALVELFLSRDGTSPNQLLANIDVNNHRILNLPVPTTNTEPARHGDLQTYVDQAEDFAEDSADSAEESETAKDVSVAAAAEAEASLYALLQRFLGAYSEEPTLTPTGDPVTAGAIYYNTTAESLYVYTGSDWIALPVDRFEALSDVATLTDNRWLYWTGTEVQGRTLGISDIPNFYLATINSQSSSYTLVLTDADGRYVRLSDGSAMNLTVPTNASVAFPVGTIIMFQQAGAGQVTVVASDGVTINTPQTLKLRGQYSGATLVKVGTNEWDLIGDLEAV